jgi:putative peptidoglycan lipid II flippase
LGFAAYLLAGSTLRNRATSFGEPIAAVLYHYGRFTAFDVVMTQQALAAYGVGLIGLILIKILAPGFYARQDIRTPVRIALLVLISTQLANIVLVPLLGHTGLALSVGLGACLNAALLWIGLHRRGAIAAGFGWAKIPLATCCCSDSFIATALLWSQPAPVDCHAE